MYRVINEIKVKTWRVEFGQIHSRHCESLQLFYDFEFLGPFLNNFAAKNTKTAVKYRTSMAIHVFLYNILHKSCCKTLNSTHSI